MGRTAGAAASQGSRDNSAQARRTAYTACKKNLNQQHQAILPLCHPPTFVALQHLGGHLVVPAQVVRQGKGDPVVLVVGLELQQRLPRLQEAGHVAHLDLQVGLQVGEQERISWIREKAVGEGSAPCDQHQRAPNCAGQ